jgi:hypothetical protein
MDKINLESKLGHYRIFDEFAFAGWFCYNDMFGLSMNFGVSNVR